MTVVSTRSSRRVVSALVVMSLFMLAGCHGPWGWGQNIVGQVGDGTASADRAGRARSRVGHAGGRRSAHAPACGPTARCGRGATTLAAGLGQGDYVDRLTPVQVGTATNWKTVSAGFDHTVALRTDGTLWVWGYNGWGQLGDGTTTPSQPSPAGRHVDVEMGGGGLWPHDRASAATGRCGPSVSTCTARSGTARRPTSPRRSRSVAPPLGPAPSGATATPSPCAPTARPGRLGSQPRGPARRRDHDEPTHPRPGGHGHQLGHGRRRVRPHGRGRRRTARCGRGATTTTASSATGRTTTRLAPTKIGTSTTWKSVAVADNHTVATRTDRTLWSWGLNDGGNLGHGTTTSVTTPTPGRHGDDLVEHRRGRLRRGRRSRSAPAPTGASGSGARATSATAGSAPG